MGTLNPVHIYRRDLTWGYAIPHPYVFVVWEYAKSSQIGDVMHRGTPMHTGY